MSEEQVKPSHRPNPETAEFLSFIRSGWQQSVTTTPLRAEVANFSQMRREQLAADFPSTRIVIPAGGLKIRSNDTDYAFRPHSAFAYFTGLGADKEPDAVLVIEDSAPEGATLFFRPNSGRETREFFADSRYGEFWVGARPSLADLSAELGIPTRHLDELEDALAKDAGVVSVAVVRDACNSVTSLVDKIRKQSGAAGDPGADEALDEKVAVAASTMRRVKDSWEVTQMREAVNATIAGFHDVVANIPEGVRRGRGERWVEGVFGLHARHEGNGVGYGSIAASGDHATILHWERNTGDLVPGELLLLDAGVEVDSLYTADITRTLPVSGQFSDVQREIYEVVLAAQKAGIAAALPGAKFSDVHAAAIRVIAQAVHDWGFLPEGVSVEDSLHAQTGQYHRRWMVHGTSHHLGIDVHDCARALREDYTDAPLQPGMIITVEPGLYFKADDLLVPESWRGIGIRIEDDILITEDGNENLSKALPRDAAEVEAWMAGIWEQSA